MTKERGNLAPGIGGTRGRAAWFAWSLVALSAALFAGGTALSFAVRSDVPELPYGGEAELYGAVFTLAPILTFSVVGAVVASRHPRNAIGWIFCGVGLLVGLSGLARGYAVYWLASGSGLGRLGETAAWFSSWSWVLLVFVPTSFLLLLFPDGRLLSPRWRPVAWCAALGITGFAAGTALQPGPLGDFPQIENPYGVDSPIVTVGTAGAILAGASMVASAVSLIVRMRRAGIVERQQIKWLAYGGAVVVGTIFASGFVSIWSAPLGVSIIGVALLGVPVFTGIAILKHRLYDIDIVINRTLVYGSLTATLALVYFGAVVTMQTLFRAITGQEQLPQLAVVVSTLAIAGLFDPLRRRIQSFIDRRFYRRKYDAKETLEAFSSKLRNQTDLRTLSNDLISVVTETMQPEHASLWLHPSAEPDEVAEKGQTR